jgi:hypothetical protein
MGLVAGRPWPYGVTRTSLAGMTAGDFSDRYWTMLCTGITSG